ncbi:MAG TPA: MarR family transcriptional regulator [Thermoanaerobaculia bacterium]|nr:MarR family transcriptional regulator [Thermoanaerobaculia bacterium]
MISKPSRKRSRSALPVKIANSVGFLLNKAAEVVRRRFDDRLAGYGLTARHIGVLSVVAADPSLKQREICDLLRIDRTTMVYLIDSLEELGLVVRKDLAGDRRSYGIEPTPKGKLVMERALADAARIEAETLLHLTSRERDAFRRVLETIVEDSNHASPK